MTTADSSVTNDFGGLDGAAAFLTNLMPPNKEGDDAHHEPSEKAGETTPEHDHSEQETPEEPSDESPEEPEEAEGEEKDQQPEKKYVDDDEVFVKVKVGDQELEVPVKDLKRLHGQEAALTRKSQEVAEQRKSVETQRTQYAAKLDAMLKRASEKANQYRQINFFALAKDPNVTPEMLNVLQTEARQALEEENYLKSDLKEFMDGVEKERQSELAKTAKDTVATLSDETNPLHIPGWSQKTYNDIRRWAVDHGVAQSDVNNLVSAPAIKIIHMAMSYEKGLSKVTTKVVNKSPKKIVKTTRAVAPKAKPVAEKQAAMKKLKSEGTTDNAVNAFLAGWATNDSE